LGLRLAHFDNARAAETWLKRDYKFSFNECQVLGELGVAIRKAQKLEQAPKSKNDDEVAEEEELKQARAKVNELRGRKRNLQEELSTLRFSAMTVAFRYLDKNFSGWLEPEDIPELGSGNFSKLDINNNHRVSVVEFEKSFRDMREAIAKLDDDILRKGRGAEDMAEQQQRAVRDSHTGTSQAVSLAEKEENLERMREERSRRVTELQDIAEFFQKGFLLDLDYLLPVPTRGHPTEIKGETKGTSTMARVPLPDLPTGATSLQAQDAQDFAQATPTREMPADQAGQQTKIGSGMKANDHEKVSSDTVVSGPDTLADHPPAVAKDQEKISPVVSSGPDPAAGQPPAVHAKQKLTAGEDPSRGVSQGDVAPP
jgi:hypothetical protein